MIALTNKSGRMLTFVLEHAPYCVALGRCACTEVLGRNPRRLPGALTLPAGVPVMNLPEALLALPAVARAVRAGQVAVAQMPPQHAEAARPRRAAS
ncbi:MAG TPA: hypothetical protein VFS43_14880 [Polyangiaceae bacterium]|nr:hypothetical protein [Polyangiaceae bacterium]